MEEPIDFAASSIGHPAVSYVTRVSGHSMAEADILDDDLVVVSRAIEARPKDIVVGRVDGDRTRNGRAARVAKDASGRSVASNGDAILVAKAIENPGSM
jgi:DNA polymerase V